MTRSSCGSCLRRRAALVAAPVAAQATDTAAQGYAPAHPPPPRRPSCRWRRPPPLRRSRRRLHPSWRRSRPRPCRAPAAPAPAAVAAPAPTPPAAAPAPAAAARGSAPRGRRCPRAACVPDRRQDRRRSAGLRGRHPGPERRPRSRASSIWPSPPSIRSTRGSSRPTRSAPRRRRMLEGKKQEVSSLDSRIKLAGKQKQDADKAALTAEKKVVERQRAVPRAPRSAVCRRAGAGQGREEVRAGEPAGAPDGAPARGPARRAGPERRRSDRAAPPRLGHPGAGAADASGPAGSGPRPPRTWPRAIRRTPGAGSSCIRRRRPRAGSSSSVPVAGAAEGSLRRSSGAMRFGSDATAPAVHSPGRAA